MKLRSSCFLFIIPEGRGVAKRPPHKTSTHIRRMKSPQSHREYKSNRKLWGETEIQSFRMLKEIFKATAHPKMKSTLPHVPRNLYDELCAIFKAGSAYYRATVIVFNSYFEFVHLALLVMFVILFSFNQGSRFLYLSHNSYTGYN